MTTIMTRPRRPRPPPRPPACASVPRPRPGRSRPLDRALSVDDQPFWNAARPAHRPTNSASPCPRRTSASPCGCLWSRPRRLDVRHTFRPTAPSPLPAPTAGRSTLVQGAHLIAVASGVGALLRIPYTFAVPSFGGRNWTVVSALLLLVPTLLSRGAVQHPGHAVLGLVLSPRTAGFGGGNFASLMANITFFYPGSGKGWALGLNAAGGNIGVAVAPARRADRGRSAPAPAALPRAGLHLACRLPVAGWPWSRLAFRCMDNLAAAKADARPTAAALRHRHTWVMSLLYIGTFGSFIGYSAALPDC